MDAPAGEVTQLLLAARQTDRNALEALIPLLYRELHGLAEARIRGEGPGHTLTPTALVHEAYLKLSGGEGFSARDRAHFLSIAARAMRQVLVDHARARNAGKREGGWARVTLDHVAGGAVRDPDPGELLALDQALDTLDRRQRQVVECRVFAGMPESEIALALEVTERTVRRDWVKARAWLADRLQDD